MTKTIYLTAREAAAELGISLDSLYVYVSRGLLRSEVGDGQKHYRRYPLEDVQRLKRRKAEFRHPDKVATGTMQAGTPVMESAITLITNERFYYRGYDALTLATTHSVEQVAALIWTGDFATDGIFSDAALDRALDRFRAMRPHLGRLTPMEAFQVCLPLAALDDIAAYDLRPEAIVQTGARIMYLLAAVAADQDHIACDIAQTLQHGWAPDDERARDLLTAALILCADQELNVTSFTARCVASAGSTLYAVVCAGLAALQGVKHAGQSERIEGFLRETGTPDQVRFSMTSLLKRGHMIPGFGEVVPGLGATFYPRGDPRGKLLLDLTAQAFPDAPAVALSQGVVQETFTLLGEYPTVFFGLVTLANTLGLPPGGAMALFALGRTIGWIGHSIEQYQTDQVIRPRARYIGPPPREQVSEME